MYLVLLETSANQRYIFTSNRLRQNVGASEITFRAGTAFVLRAVAEVLQRAFLAPDNEGSPAHIRSFLRNSQDNPPIESPNSPGIEFIQATSGKALLLVRDKKVAKEVVRNATLIALKEAPGLDLTGVVSDAFDFWRDPIGRFNQQVHRRLAQVRQARPGLELRFCGLPVVEQCASSGYPANALDQREGPVSLSILKKIEAAEEGWSRMKAIAPKAALFEDLNDLEEMLDDTSRWVAVIHADGNGLGQVFTSFGVHLQQSGDLAWENRQYVDHLRAFSLALEEATEDAFRQAVEEIPKRETGGRTKLCGRPLIPLVVGGDDLTVICEAGHAFPFVHRFLIEFEKAMNRDELCRKIWPNPSMAAGIAFVKPHFPFYLAYELAEQLLRSAKRVKHRGLPRIPSAFDFHVLHDFSGADLDVIRSRLEYPENGRKVRLYGGPYIVNGFAEPLRERSWDKFKNRVQAIRAKRPEDGRRKLPSSQLHWLREGLFKGKREAERRLKLIYPRYRDAGLSNLLHFDQSLFFEEEGQYVTGFLDAMEAATVWTDVGSETPSETATSDVASGGGST